MMDPENSIDENPSSLTGAAKDGTAAPVMNPAAADLRTFFGALVHELINQVGTVSVHLQMCEVAETTSDIHNSILRAESGTQDLISLLQLLGEWSEGFAPEIHASRTEWAPLAQRLVQMHVNRYAFQETKVEVVDNTLTTGQLLFQSNETSLFDLSRSSLALQMLNLLMSKRGLSSHRDDSDLLLNFG